MEFHKARKLKAMRNRVAELVGENQILTAQLEQAQEGNRQLKEYIQKQDERFEAR